MPVAIVDSFKTLKLLPDDISVIADKTSDTLTLNGGIGISLVFDPTNDSISIHNSGEGLVALDDSLEINNISNRPILLNKLTVNGGYDFTITWAGGNDESVPVSATIAAGGYGYVVGDIVTILAGNSDCTYRVTSINSTGAVTGMAQVTPGTGYPINFNGCLTQLNRARLEAATDYDLRLKTSGTGAVFIDSDQALRIPVGDTAVRPAGITGQLRFNSETAKFEGFNGANWIGLGGIQDSDGNTYITTETTTGGNQNTITFVANGSTVATFDENLNKFFKAVEIDNDLNVNGDVNIDGGDVTTSATTFNLLNTTATTVNFAGAATALNVGATTGTLTLNNPTISGTQSTVNLWNTTSTTVNFAGAATTLNIGAATGTTTFNNDLDVDGNVNIDGTLSFNNNVLVKTVNGTSIGIGIDSLGNISSGVSNTSLGNESLVSNTSGSNNAAFGYRTLRLNVGGVGGSAFGALALNQSTGNFNTAFGYNAGSNITSGSNNLVIGNSATASSATVSNEITFGNASITKLRIPGLNLEYTPTGAWKLPVGTSLERPVGVQGQLRYNTTTGSYEGFDGTNWVGLGGVIDSDRNTYITAELTYGANDNTLRFYTDGSVGASLSPNALIFNNSVSVNIPNTNTTLALGQGALVVGGGVSIAGNLIVGGEIINASLANENSVSTTGTCTPNVSTNVITVDNSVIGAFKAGKNIKIFGASENITEQLTTGLGVSLARVGFTTPGVGAVTVTFSYRVAQFDFVTGKYSAADSAENINILLSEINNFNNTNNLQLTLARQSTSKGILIYRKVGAEIDYKLIAVLGSKELGSNIAGIPWTDYYSYDLTPWGLKDSTNAFDSNSGVVHFPITPPGASGLGWFTTSITQVNSTLNTITTADNFIPNSIVLVYNDDTEEIQNLIGASVVANNNAIRLDARVYYVSQLDIPKDYTFYGAGLQTRIIKLPWSTNLNTGSNEILTIVGSAADAKNIALRNFSLNGNAQNQYLAADTTNEYANYAIRLFGSDITVESTEITNVVGGGLYMFDSLLDTTDVSVYQNQINSGCLSYRYDYSPLYLTTASGVRVTQNTFADFPLHVDVSAVTKGVVTNNIIDNCGSGLFGFGVISTIINPNVLLGAAGELLPNPDVLNSEYDSVNIRLEPNVDFISPAIVYQENGANFDLTANQGSLSFAINELRKVSGVEVISTDYSKTTGSVNYISFNNSVDGTQGQIKFRIQTSLVNDLLSRANFEALYAINTNTQGLVYRIFQTEYVPLTTVASLGAMSGSDYQIEVNDASVFAVNDIVRFVGHNSTPSIATVDGTITSINTITNVIKVNLGVTVTAPSNTGSVALKNTFVVVKGKIN